MVLGLREYQGLHLSLLLGHAKMDLMVTITLLKLAQQDKYQQITLHYQVMPTSVIYMNVMQALYCKDKVMFLVFKNVYY